MKTVNIVKSSTGKSLKKPLHFEVPEPKSELEDRLQQYVLQSFICRAPYLAQFCLQNSSTMKVAKHLLLHTKVSRATLYNYIFNINNFTQWLKKSPDFLISRCLDINEVTNLVFVAEITRLMDDYLASLRAERKLAPATSYTMVRYVVLFFKLNRVQIEFPYLIKKWSLYPDRSPTQQELQKILDISTLREKVIICALTTGGFRLGTLVQLKYRHVKHDLERGIVPIHIHVEGEITKTKYHDYDTFVNFETANYLKIYLQKRKDGTYKEGNKTLAAQNITDESPLISSLRKQALLTTDQIRYIIHSLYLRAGLIGENIGLLNNGIYCRRFDIRPHSTRKFFRSQLAFLGVDRDFIEYMVGHKVSGYFDVKARGIEFLRSIYTKAGCTPKTDIWLLKNLRKLLEFNSYF